MPHRRFLSLLVMLCAVGVARAGVIADYQARIEKLSHDAITAELEKHPERWDKLSMKFRFRIDPSGRIHDIRILSGVPNGWAEATARRALTSLKLPPVPTQVMKAAGINGCDAEAQLVLAKKQADGIRLVRDQKKLQW
jgi:hypothetical protein